MRQESQVSPETTSTPWLTQQEWTPEQKQLISVYVEQRAELMNMCIEAAKGKFGDRFEDEAIVRDLANSLYLEAIRKFNL